MNNSLFLSAPRQNLNTHENSSFVDPRQAAAHTAIATRGNWSTEYGDLIVPNLPKLRIWPEGWGLIVIQDGRALDTQRLNPIPLKDINYENNVVLILIVTRDGNGNRVHHYNLSLPDDEEDKDKGEIAGDGDCLFRAVVAGWQHGKRDVDEDWKISLLRGEMANYIFDNWDEVSAFAAPDPEWPGDAHEGTQPSASHSTSARGDAFISAELPRHLEQPRHEVKRSVGQGGSLANEAPRAPLPAAPSQSQAAASMTPKMEMLHQASGIGRQSTLTIVITQLQFQLERTLGAIDRSKIAEKDTEGLVSCLQVVNDSLTAASPAEKAAWIEHCLQNMFVTDARHPVSKAQRPLAHRNSPELRSVADALMTFMENAAQQLKGVALTRFGQLLGVDTTLAGKDHGIAQGFSQASTAVDPAQLGARFERLRDEFGMSF
ncbi:hypothetical protein HDC30_002447 [Pseudomonas sp. JAI115]|uniref:OTU domain-containing protein n=1 Tax=Pseudomonas sp. JAI115 TaxID=2723061 RepID=UPI001610D0B6|nr:OTU domain-containing protein [Pseudomonas sp. JAI115]MBB6155224.1 hypothetical protein [Pseudomonas sp. JAI115]